MGTLYISQKTLGVGLLFAIIVDTILGKKKKKPTTKKPQLSDMRYRCFSF